MHLSRTGVGARDNTRTVSLYGHRVVSQPSSPSRFICIQGTTGPKTEKKTLPWTKRQWTQARSCYQGSSHIRPTVTPERVSAGRSEHRSRNHYRVPFRHCILSVIPYFHYYFRVRVCYGKVLNHTITISRQSHGLGDSIPSS